MMRRRQSTDTVLQDRGDMPSSGLGESLLIVFSDFLLLIKWCKLLQSLMSHIFISGVTVTSPTPVKARPHPLSVTNAERQMMKVTMDDDK